VKIAASIGNFNITGQDAFLRYRALSLVSTRIRLLANKAPAKYCQPQATSTWFAISPGAISLPVAPAPIVNSNPAPSNSVLIPPGFNVDDPDLCQLFQDILPVNAAPVYPEEQSVDVLWRPFSEIIKTVSVLRSFIKAEKLDYPLTLEDRKPILRLKPVIQLINKQLKTDAYAFALSGADASFNYTGNLKGLSGKFILGRPFSWLLRFLRIQIEAGFYNIDGQGDLLYGRLIAASAASFEITVQDTYLNFTKAITASFGDFQSSGFPAGFLLDQVIGANTGAFNVISQDIRLIYERPDLLADSGSYVLTGAEADLHRALICDLGAFDLSGKDADIRWSQILSTEPGDVVVIGQDSSLLRASYLEAESSTFVLTAGEAALLYNYLIIADNANILLDLKAASLKTAKRLAANGGLITIAGQKSVIYADAPYFSSFATQWYGWDSDFYPDWWAD
jgi:hypothetical protein